MVLGKKNMFCNVQESQESRESLDYLLRNRILQTGSSVNALNGGGSVFPSVELVDIVDIRVDKPFLIYVEMV